MDQYPSDKDIRALCREYPNLSYDCARWWLSRHPHIDKIRAQITPHLTLEDSLEGPYYDNGVSGELHLHLYGDWRVEFRALLTSWGWFWDNPMVPLRWGEVFPDDTHWRHYQITVCTFNPDAPS